MWRYPLARRMDSGRVYDFLAPRVTLGYLLLPYALISPSVGGFEV
jgi:hypothetical protein